MRFSLPPAATAAFAALLALSGCDASQPARTGEGVETADEQSPREGPIISRERAGEAPGDAAFRDTGGARLTLADYRGKPVVLNLWATWCRPCVTEMPTLDALAASRGDIAVLTVSQDISKPDKVASVFARGGYQSLADLRDPENALWDAFGARALPFTVLLDAEGREVLRVTGPLDWAGPQAEALIDEAAS